jgi:O-Antigen ligase
LIVGSPAAPTAAARRAAFRGLLAWRPDTGSLLAVLVFATFVIPARFVVKGVGAFGTPADLLGFGMFLLWVFARMMGSRPAIRFQPARVIAAIYLFAILVTYAGGFARGLFPDEANSATRLVLETIAGTGIALVTADAISNRQQLNTALQRVVYGAAFMAATGDFEAITGYNVAQHMRFPGLKVNRQLIGSAARGAGHRVAGTATHYIEFGVVLAMLLPLAIHFAVFAPTRGRRQANWLFVLLIAMGIPFSISRAAALAAVLSVLVLAAAWTWRARVNAAIVGLVTVLGIAVGRPGLVTTIVHLFTKAGSDPSISGRTTDYGPSFAFIRERPWFGRGAGTFTAGRYRILDNQVLLTTIESGIVGVVALTALFAGGAAIAHRVAKFSPEPQSRHLGYALVGAFAAAFVTSFTFDSLTFGIFRTVLFLLIGVAGALWRLDRPVRQAHPHRSARRATADDVFPFDEDATA